jgi:hypothetical protein
MSDERSEAFEAQTKRAFDESVAALDGSTRAKLAAARREALERASAPGIAAVVDRWLNPAWLDARTLVPAGVAASALVAAWVAWQPAVETGVRTASLDDLEILLGEEDLEMIEDLEFYVWLEEALDAPAPGDDIG